MRRKKAGPQLVVCVRNEGSEDLELRKIYQALPDEAAAEDGYVRVVDESGEDYLYPKEYFVEADLPGSTEKAIIEAA